MPVKRDYRKLGFSDSHIPPDVRLFELFLQTFNIEPGRAVYIDDHRSNVDVATALGMHGVLFTDPPALRSELVKVRLIPG